jgi:hypothetical protein
MKQTIVGQLKTIKKMEKQCKTCKEIKNMGDFHKSTRYKDGKYYMCKTCVNAGNKAYRDKNKEAFSKTRKKNYERNIDKMRKEKREYYAKNTDAKREYDLVYRVENKEKIKEYKKVWDSQDRQKIQSRIKRNLRRRIIHVIQSGYKSDSTMNLLGCSIDFFLDYLEKQFDSTMNWENYGQFGWHIDHILPCDSFDLTLEVEQRKCFHYSNLRPLWWTDNLSKSKKIL